MEAFLENPFDELDLDRSDWQLVRFGDVAIQQNQSVDRENTELTRYVKGEHMFSEDLHLREWGELKDEYLGPAFIRKFEEGDILYGSRRTYLRKVVIAPFEGITSNTTFVIKANEELIDKGLLPFVMMSEGFTQHSIRNSKGSVNPYVNWKDIASYEFYLPAPDLQKKIIALLNASDDLIEMELVVRDKLKRATQILFESLVNTLNGKYVPLSEVLVPKKEKSTAPNSRDKYIGLEHIVSGDFSCSAFGDASKVLAQCNIINAGDLCYSKLRPYLDKAFIASFDAISTTELLIYETIKASKKYVLYLLHSESFVQYVAAQGFGTKMPRVSHEIVGEYPIKILENEDELLRKMSVFENSILDISKKINASKAVFNGLINQVF